MKFRSKFVYAAPAALVLWWSCTVAAAATTIIDVAAPGTPFSPGVHGQSVPDTDITTSAGVIAVPQALEVARGSSIRGVAGGLEADTFDWKSRNNSPRPSTLQYLRWARDYDAELLFTANIRGIVGPDPSDATKKIYTDTSIATVTQLAADWVRYTNHIVPTYRKDQVVTDPADAAILNSLSWSSATPGDNWDKLLPAGEAAVPKVKYWEIGNEPRVPVSSFGITNSFTFLTPNHTIDSTHKYDYAQRYASMTAAMKREDSTIKVGPCLQNGTTIASERELLDSVLKPQTDGSFLPVDFISYHPYEKMGSLSAPADISAHLRNIYATQASFANGLRNVVAADGRDPNSVELIASETNVSNFDANDTIKEAQMAHALGTVETAFSHARLGLHDSNYWVWPAHRFYGTQYPVYKAFEGLRDHMGDRLLSVVEDNNARVYTTKNSATGEIAIWGLNFDNDLDLTEQITLDNFAGADEITLLRLGSIDGTRTTLTSANLAPDMAGGPTSTVGWTSTDLSGIADLNNYTFALPAATISVLVVHPVPEPASFAAGVFGAAAFSILRRRRR